MLEAVGSKVVKLVRTAIGEVQIGDLVIGRYRPLREREVRALQGRM
jgi:16S rRNA U516 pseudouridylate synthase RsuA-like enzyme